MFNKYFDATEDNIDALFANITVKNIHFALISLDCILSRPDFDETLYQDEHTYYFFHIQSLLTACGNISNVFYNNSWRVPTTSQRSKRLREQFNISKAEFPLVFQKEGRNTNEHFDERYDHYKGHVGDYNIIDENTPAAFQHTIQNEPHLRTLDRINGVYITYNYVFRQITYNLHHLYSELVEMRDRITSNPLFDSAWVDNMPGEILQ